MPAIIALLGEVLAILSALTGYTSNILGFVGTAAQEHTKYAIERIAAAAANTVNSPTFGNAAIKAEIAALTLQLASDVASLTLQISDLTDGTTPVSLPVVAPSGYGGLDGSATFAAVWLGDMPTRSYPIWNYLYAAGNWGAFSSNLRWLGDEVLYFQAVFGSWDYVPGAADWVPAFDPTDILVGEDILDCLTRQNPGWTVAWAFAPDGYVRLTFPGSAEIQEWQSTFDQTGFAAIKSQIFPISSIEIAPSWPGIANVTLGAPVAITPQMTITTPMDGVIVTITSVAANKPSLPYDSQTAYKFIGALSFVDDNGDVEPFQTLAFTNALYCPRQMTRASSVVVRCDASLAGTITPWVIA